MNGDSRKCRGGERPLGFGIAAVGQDRCPTATLAEPVGRARSCLRIQHAGGPEPQKIVGRERVSWSNTTPAPGPGSSRGDQPAARGGRSLRSMRGGSRPCGGEPASLRAGPGGETRTAPVGRASDPALGGEILSGGTAGLPCSRWQCGPLQGGGAAGSDPFRGELNQSFAMGGSDPVESGSNSSNLVAK